MTRCLSITLRFNPFFYKHDFKSAKVTVSVIGSSGETSKPICSQNVFAWIERGSLGYQATDTNRVGGLNNPIPCVADQRPTYPLALKRPIHCQPPENDDRNRIGHISTKSARCFNNSNRTGCQRIIGDNTSAIADNKSPRRSCCLVLLCPALEPCIQTVQAGHEPVKLMAIRQQLRRGKNHAFSHGAGVCIVLRKPSPGHGCISNRARNFE